MSDTYPYPLASPMSFHALRSLFDAVQAVQAVQLLTMEINFHPNLSSLLCK